MNPTRFNPTRAYGPRALTRCALATVAAAGLVVAGAATAWAHVDVEAGDAAAGGTDVTLTFHVPNEEAPAVTTAITFTFPIDHPLVGVTAESQNGFTPTITTAHLAAAVPGPSGSVSDVVSRITFSGGTIVGEEYPAFRIHVDKLPEAVTTMNFTAEQTYSDGSIVYWSEIAADGATEPDHPAPVLELAPDQTGRGAATAPPATVSAATSPDSTVGQSSVTSGPTGTSPAVVIGGIALLGTGIALFLRRG